ncbi:MAG: carbon-nitrogen hydrolase family protein [Polyangiaceae bacterium]|nr:carbon-nitrogen hydrolase family protein [Polyangiaceae bacterium]MCW5791890.1 carbon-nitrogen hydrolase family protein [Polyangiaceae bacterium]
MSQERMRVAVVQLNASEDVEANLAALTAQVEAAAADGAELIGLPENATFLGSEQLKCEQAEIIGAGVGGAEGVADPRGPDPSSPVQARLAALAARHGVYLLVGGVPEHSGDESRPYNTSVLFDRSGVTHARYRKIHLFDIDLPGGGSLRESHATTGGDEVVVTEVVSRAGRRCKLGLSVCYDLRFPELYRAQVAAGAEILTVPAAFTAQTGPAHWRVLLRARAIENQCWLLAPAQWGKHPRDRASHGHAMIVDPWGTVVAECSEGVGFAAATLDFSYQHQVRSRLPCLSHRRLP